VRGLINRVDSRVVGKRVGRHRNDSGDDDGTAHDLSTLVAARLPQP
jgi:hypothetical protein